MSLKVSNCNVESPSSTIILARLAVFGYWLVGVSPVGKASREAKEDSLGRRRVVITGIGVVAPNGVGKDTFWQNLVAGKSTVDRIQAFDPSPYPCVVAAEVRDFEPRQFMHPRRVKQSGRFSHFAVAAAKLAQQDSGSNHGVQSSGRTMACIGTSINGAGDIYEKGRVGFERSGLDGIPLMTSLEYAAHSAVSHVSTELGIRGTAMTLGSACVTGLDALHWGYAGIQTGDADVVYAGSSEAPISEFCFATLCALGILTKLRHPPSTASRPYDLNRDGVVLGEGAAILVLEEYEHALDRGAHVYAEILGFGHGNEAGHGARRDAGLLGGSETGELALTEAIQTALTAANLGPRDVDYINSHGNALPEYDKIETRAFKRAFGPAAYAIPVSSIKSMIGHAMGAASALQAAAACLALQHSTISPTINLESADPECDLDYVPHRARIARLRTVLINSHGFGGTHTVALFGAPRR